jgi:putative N6-adenine-specific DNA methylase
MCRQKAKDASYTSHYTIHGSDKDDEMLTIARANAERAWVADTIQFRYHDFLWKDSDISTSKTSPLSVVTNPPYGQRMENDVEEIHRKLAYMDVKTMTVISGYEEATSILIGPSRKRRNTKNGAKEVVICMK